MKWRCTLQTIGVGTLLVAGVSSAGSCSLPVHAADLPLTTAATPAAHGMSLAATTQHAGIRGGAPTVAGSPFVARNGTELTLNGEPYRFDGINIYDANSDGSCGPAMSTGDGLDVSLSDMPGIEAFRSWFFQAMATSNNARDWSAFDHTLAVAAAHGVKVIATLANQWGACDSSSGYKSLAWYQGLYSSAVQSGDLTTYRQWVSDVVTRYKDNPTILMWQLVNEPEAADVGGGSCQENAAATALTSFATDVGGLVHSLDSNHLVSLGALGTGQCGMSNGDYQSVNASAGNDLCEYHDYGSPTAPMPGDAFNGLQVRLDQCGALNKPLFVGETGIIPDDPGVGGSYGARANLFDAKFRAQFAAGVVGELPWAWELAGSSLTDYDIGPGDPTVDLFTRYPPPDVPTASAGFYHSCGVRTDGTVECWGDNTDGAASPPAGTFRMVSAGGYHHSCGVGVDGTVACWGDDTYGQSSSPPGTFTTVSAGFYNHSCGVRTDGTLACWGQNTFGKATPPAGTFTTVSAGWSTSCGVQTDGTVVCWGQNLDGSGMPPAGTFTMVSSGTQHSCGVQTDGTVACWGDDSYGQSSPPAGTFTTVSAGDQYTCGIRTDGTMACWGDDNTGEAHPQTGTFAAVSAGWIHSCAVRTDGTVDCWGDDSYGEARPAFTDAPPPASAGQSYTFTFTTTFMSGPAFSVAAGTLPPGFTLSTTGTLSGSTTTSGVYGPITVAASDGLAQADPETFSLTVTAGPLDHLVLSPATATIAAGGSQGYAAEGFDHYGNDIGDVTAATTVTIAPDGSCSASSCAATRVGSHTVTGDDGGKTGAASLQVTAASLDHLVVSPATGTITSGGTRLYTATGYDQYGNSLGGVTAATTFSISPDGSCSASACTAAALGAHTVTAHDGTASGDAVLNVDGANQLNAVTCPSAATFCTAVGSYQDSANHAQTLIEVAQGSGWQVVASPNTSTSQDNELRGVSCPSTAGTCMAVGDYQNAAGAWQTLIEISHGSGWSRMSSPNTSTTQDNHLGGVSCWSTTLCVAVGYYISSAGHAQTLIEQWNGVRWSRVTSPNTSTTQDNVLQGVSCPSTGFCMAVGVGADSSGRPQTLIEKWNGSVWSRVSSPDASPNDNELAGVSCTNASFCIAVGHYESSTAMQTLTAKWNGSTWSQVTSPNTGTDNNSLESVSCTSAGFCMAAGFYTTISGGVFQTLTEKWDGTGWSLLSSPNTSAMQDNLVVGVSCRTARYCISVGSYNASTTATRTLIVFWNGTRWSQQTSRNM